MEWTTTHDVLLCREILVVEPYKVKERTPQRGILWETVAEKLNNIKVPMFKVDKRSVRDHFNKVLLVRHKKKMSDEKKASGISPEQTELDALMEEIMERMQASEESFGEENDNARQKAEKDKCAAQDVRLQAMERMSETKKRKGADDSKEKKKVRRSNGNDTIAYLREKAEIETQLRRDELDLKKRDQDNELQRYEQLEHQQNSMVQMLERQSQQQQQQMQQFQMMFVQQQQQQSQIMMSLLDKLASKNQ